MPFLPAPWRPRPPMCWSGTSAAMVRYPTKLKITRHLPKVSKRSMLPLDLIFYYFHVVPGPLLAAVGDFPTHNLTPISMELCYSGNLGCRGKFRRWNAQGIQKIKIYALNLHPNSCIRHHGSIYDATACYSRPQLKKTVKFQKCIFENVKWDALSKAFKH